MYPQGLIGAMDPDVALARDIKHAFGAEDWQEYWQDGKRAPNAYSKLATVIGEVMTRTEERRTKENIVGGLRYLLGNDEREVNNCSRSQAARLYKAALNEINSELDKIDKSDDYENDEVRDAARQEKLDERQAALVIACSISQLYPDLAFVVNCTDQKMPLFITAAQYGLAPIVNLMIKQVSLHLHNETDFEKALHDKLDITFQGRSALCWAALNSKYDVIDEILSVDATLAEHERLVENLLPLDSTGETALKREKCVRLVLERCPSLVQPNYFLHALETGTRIAKLFLNIAEASTSKIKMLDKDTATWLIKNGTDQQWDMICASYSNQWAESIGKEDLELLHLAVENRKVSVVRYLSRKFPNLAIAKATRNRYPLQYNHPNSAIEADRSDSSDEEHDVPSKPVSDGSQGQPSMTEPVGFELQAMKDIQDAIVPAIIKAAKTSYDAHRILRLCKGKDVMKHIFEGN